MFILLDSSSVGASAAEVIKQRANVAEFVITPTLISSVDLHAGRCACLDC